MKEVVVGIYGIGYEQCQLLIKEGTGADFCFLPERGKIPNMRIGGDEREWWRVVSALLHESFEFAFDRQRLRYQASSDLTHNHAQYLFVCNHQQFEEACAEVGDFISVALPDLGRAWKEWQKKRKGAK